MRLADFIEAHMDEILAEWVTFARQVSAAGRTMDLDALRDHAVAMLNTIAADLRTGQSDAEQVAKSLGDAPEEATATDTAAQVHGAGRAISGFTVSEMVAEYRALRASVLRLWTAECGALKGKDIDDIIRFNEAIDQSIAESIERYDQDVERSKEMFLAILGHDLRSPLAAIVTASDFMLKESQLEPVPLRMAGAISRSAKRANTMVETLIDLTRTRLGAGIPVVLVDADLWTSLNNTIEETKSAHPDRTIIANQAGQRRGQFDSARLSQLFGNLLSNAIYHGDAGTPICVDVRDERTDIVVRVQNHGKTIPADEIGGIFEPFKRPSASDSADPSNHLGLGLYIAEQIVTAHHGTIGVESSTKSGTTFTVRLPRATHPVHTGNGTEGTDLREPGGEAIVNAGSSKGLERRETDLA